MVDIAIWLETAGSVLNKTNETVSETIDCDFEEGLCGWTQLQYPDDDGNWIVISGTNSDESLKASLDTYNNTRSRHYMSVNTSNLPMDGTAKLVSPPILGSSGPFKLAFWYRISLGAPLSLRIYGDKDAVVWPLFGEGSWKKAIIPFALNSTFQITFEALKDKCVSPVEIAIDDITLTENPEPEWVTAILVTNPLVERYGGQLVCLIITGMLPSEVGNIELTWTLNGLVIEQSSRIDIATWNFDSEFGQMTMGVLLFEDVFITDRGEYSCSGQRHGVVSGMTKGDVTVYQRPKVQIIPTTAYFSPGETVKLTCNITNVDDINMTMFLDFLDFQDTCSAYLYYTDLLKGGGDQGGSSVIVWCFQNMSMIPDGLSSYRIMDASSTLSHLEILEPHQDFVYCGAKECTERSALHVIEEGSLLCLESIENGVIWAKTMAGSKQIQLCPYGYAGSVSRVCDVNGNWKGINYSSCVKDEFVGIRDIINADSDIEPQTMKKALTLMYNALITESQESIRELEVNDIQTGAAILKEISTVSVKFNSVKGASKTTQAFAVVVDTLIGKTTDILEGKHENEHNSTVLLLQRLIVAKAIIESVENFGHSVIRSLESNQSVEIRTDNVEILIGRTPLDQGVYFPQHPMEADGGISTFELSSRTLRNLGLNDEVSLTAARYRELGALLNSYPRKYQNRTDNKTGETSYPDLPSLVNSDVLSLSINATSDFMDPPISLTFKHHRVELQEPTCVFYSHLMAEWSTDGCKLVSSDRHTTVCQCNHLTNFAILMSPAKNEPTQSHQEGLKVISLVGCSISVVCCLITVLVYIKFWRYVKSRRSSLILSLSLVLAAGYLLFMLGVDKTENKTGCMVIAVFLHYIFLTVFSIMLAIAIDIVLAIVQVFVSTSKWWPLLLFAWGSPVIIVGISLGATQLKGYGDKYFCWLRGTTLYAFVAPVLLIILVNAAILIYALKVMYSTHFMKSKSPKQRVKSGIRSVCSLLPLLGLTWLFGVLAINEDLVVFQYLFAIFNSVQGILVFVFHCVLNGQIRKAVIQRFRRRRVLHISATTSKDDSVKTKSTAVSEALKAEKGSNLTHNTHRDSDAPTVAPIVHTDEIVMCKTQYENTKEVDIQGVPMEREVIAITNMAYEEHAEESRMEVQGESVR